MIFAIQMTDPKPTRLRVSGDVGTPAPPMTSLRSGDSEPSSIGCVDGSWTMDLDAGDYLIEIQVEHWVPGRLDIVTELVPGQSPPTFVDYGPLPLDPSLVGLAAWEAMALTIDDSKDPWPPPPPPTTPTVTLAQVSSEWFTAELAAARTRITAQLADAGGKSPPASVLAALVTGR
ncbi:MAG TPA: hypothetical protein VHN14_20465 [Kofleriaceae bacterium]|nr:hypothetical protein [Kofleriaceae bacterium]